MAGLLQRLIRPRILKVCFAAPLLAAPAERLRPALDQNVANRAKQEYQAADVAVREQHLSECRDRHAQVNRMAHQPIRPPGDVHAGRVALVLANPPIAAKRRHCRQNQARTSDDAGQCQNWRTRLSLRAEQNRYGIPNHEPPVGRFANLITASRQPPQCVGRAAVTPHEPPGDQNKVNAEIRNPSGDGHRNTYFGSSTPDLRSSPLPAREWPGPDSCCRPWKKPPDDRLTEPFRFNHPRKLGPRRVQLLEEMVVMALQP